MTNAIDVSAKDVTEQESYGDELLYLLPEEITIPDESLNVRPYSSRQGGNEKEAEAIANLAESIADPQVGQLQPVKVRYDDKGGYTLVAGRRRTMAVNMVNAGKSANEPLMRVKCILTKDVAEPKKVLGIAYKQAIHENTHRQNHSPMDDALNISTIRKRFKWQGKDGTAKVADFLKVSPATVTQYEKLLKLDEDIQQKIHNGEISRDAAFVLVEVKPEKRAEVLDKAKELQEQENKQAEQKQADAKAKGKPTPRTKKKGVSSKNVKAAARETAGATNKPQPRSRKEIVEFFEGMDGPASGAMDGIPRRFLVVFSEWVQGKQKDDLLEKAWFNLIEKADKGSAKEPDKKPFAKRAKAKTVTKTVAKTAKTKTTKTRTAKKK